MFYARLVRWIGCQSNRSFSKLSHYQLLKSPIIRGIRATICVIRISLTREGARVRQHWKSWAKTQLSYGVKKISGYISIYVILFPVNSRIKQMSTDQARWQPTHERETCSASKRTYFERIQPDNTWLHVSGVSSNRAAFSIHNLGRNIFIYVWGETKLKYLTNLLINMSFLTFHFFGTFFRVKICRFFVSDWSQSGERMRYLWGN